MGTEIKPMKNCTNLFTIILEFFLILMKFRLIRFGFHCSRFFFTSFKAVLILLEFWLISFGLHWALGCAERALPLSEICIPFLRGFLDVSKLTYYRVYNSMFHVNFFVNLKTFSGTVRA